MIHSEIYSLNMHQWQPRQNHSPLLNWSLKHFLIEVNGPKTKICINMALIAIQDSLVGVFPAPLGCLFLARVSVHFHINAKDKFGKKKV